MKWNQKSRKKKVRRPKLCTHHKVFEQRFSNQKKGVLKIAHCQAISKISKVSSKKISKQNQMSKYHGLHIPKMSF